jgi:hypothetical protein
MKDKCTYCNKPVAMSVQEGKKEIKLCIRHYKIYLDETENKHELPATAKRKRD